MNHEIDALVDGGWCSGHGKLGSIHTILTAVSMMIQQLVQRLWHLLACSMHLSGERKGSVPSGVDFGCEGRVKYQENGILGRW